MRIGTAGIQPAYQSGGCRGIQRLRGEIQNLRQDIQKRRIELRKLHIDKSLTQEQKEAKQELLQSQIDNLQRQMEQKRQQLQEMQEKRAEQQKGAGNPQAKQQESGKSPDQVQAQAVDAGTAHEWIAAGSGIETVEKLGMLKDGFKRDAKVQARLNASDAMTFSSSGGALEISREALSDLKCKVRQLESEISERLGDLLGSKQPDDQACASGKSDETQPCVKQEERDENQPEQVDVYA